MFLFIHCSNPLHPTAFLQPLKCNFQLEHLHQTFLKLLISALLLDFFFLFDKHTNFKYKLNLSVSFLYHLSSGPRFLCWYQKLFFQLFQNSDSLLPTFFSPPEWNAIETEALILLILKHMLNININAFKDHWLFAEAVVIVVHCFGSAIIWLNEFSCWKVEKWKTKIPKYKFTLWLDCMYYIILKCDSYVLI